ncbi:NADPH-dependent F420 reductase [Streptomyces sp. NPDC059688]|uniref:NADPH-dependent F420 reductase n=1 Tax=Streptomyces sp. NPDC059688 TaxID=3346906 RepID=UPI0036953708
MKILVIGQGNVGSVLIRRLAEVGHDVVGANSATDRADVARHALDAEVVILAMPFGAVHTLDPMVKESFGGKTVIDATNPLAPDSMSLLMGHTTSGAETLAAAIPGANVVKAFSNILAPNHAEGSLGGAFLFAPVASDHEGAKQTAMALAIQLGFDAVDAGPLSNARYIESATELLIQLAYGRGLGAGIGLSLARA